MLRSASNLAKTIEVMGTTAELDKNELQSELSSMSNGCPAGADDVLV
jgi:hypothetical protein